MSTKITLKNTLISFVPSFSGGGWETSLMPRLEHKYCRQHAVQITFTWIKKLFSKMQNSRQEGGAMSWTSVIARMFL